MALLSGSTLQGRSDLHLLRKTWHFLGILGMIGVYNYFGQKLSWNILMVAIGIVLPIEFFRHNYSGFNRIVVRVLGPLMRQNELNSLSGTTYLLLGTAVLLGAFSRHIVNLSLLFLAIGDPLASYFGIRFGRDKIVGSKTLQGTLAALAACTVIALFYCYSFGLMLERLMIVVPVAGLIGAMTELIPIGKLDDNFSAPVLSAIALSALFYLYGGFGV